MKVLQKQNQKGKISILLSLSKPTDSNPVFLPTPTRMLITWPSSHVGAGVSQHAFATVEPWSPAPSVRLSVCPRGISTLHASVVAMSHVTAPTRPSRNLCPGPAYRQGLRTYSIIPGIIVGIPLRGLPRPSLVTRQMQESGTLALSMRRAACSRLGNCLLFFRVHKIVKNAAPGPSITVTALLPFG